MQVILNHMRRAAEEVFGGVANTRHGIIDGYDPDNYAVRVRLQPEGELTDWLPLKAVAVGNGWGAFFAPNIGDWVEVDFQEADGDSGSIGFRFYTDQARPLSVPAGEMWLVHQAGASFKLTGDGAATFDSGGGASIKVQGGTITSAGTWNHDGSITATGEGTFNGGHTVSQHTHPSNGAKPVG